MSNPSVIIPVLRHVLGYAVGIGLFLVIIPYGLYWIAGYTAGIRFANIPVHGIPRVIIAIPLLIAGLIFAVWSNLDLLRVGKGGPTDGLGITISPRSQHLVVSGSYRYTRNPMVFGTYMLYFAFVAYLGSLAAILVLVLTMILFAFYLKATEEKRLERDFGDAYRDYRRRVSMILPLPPKK